MKENFSPAEWQARVELAAVYRLIDHFRYTDTIYNHISLRLDHDDTILINPFGLLYNEIKASNLVKITVEGEILHDPTGLGINRAGYVIHGAIHSARPDVTCVIHTHSRAGIAVSAQEEGLLPISQHAALMYGRIGYHDFEGIAVNLDEQQRLVRDLGEYYFMILRNHGLLTAGRSPGEALQNMINLERACDAQVAALAGGVPVRRISEEALLATRKAVEQYGNDFSTDWAAMLRLAHQVAPGFDI